MKRIYTYTLTSFQFFDILSQSTGPSKKFNRFHNDLGFDGSVDLFTPKNGRNLMPKKRKYIDPSVMYVHGSTGKILLKKAIIKFGSLRQVALRLSCSNAHVYRMFNLECRMKISWYQDIQKLLEQ